MKLVTIPWNEQFLNFVLCALIATALMSPLSSDLLLPALYDIYNHLAGIVQAKMALVEGQFPIRVAPLEQNGWQYPYFQFYSPTTYTLAGIIYGWLTPTNPYLAYKIVLWCALVIGGVYTHRLGYWVTRSTIAASVATTVYLTSPYMIFLIDHMGAFNEAVALGILPAVMYFTLQCYYFSFTKKTFLQVSLVWFLLATVHLVSFIFTSIFVFLYLFFISLAEKKFSNSPI